jgi:hypothetical protein
MKTAQGWGWLAAGVLALGLNGVYQDGGAAWVHRVVDCVVERVAGQTRAVADLASERFGRLAGTVNLAAAKGETTSCRLTAAMARLQGKMEQAQAGFAHVEAMSARQEAALARVEANRARIESHLAHLRMIPAAFNSMEIPVVDCPRVRVNIPRVNVPELPMVRIPAPVVHVEMPGAGPV